MMRGQGPELECVCQYVSCCAKFVARRRDARYCSPACRQAACRVWRLIRGIKQPTAILRSDGPFECTSCGARRKSSKSKCPVCGAKKCRRSPARPPA
jgi:hypothetical protein